MIRERIIPHIEYRNIYPNAVNTIKIMTYILDGRIYHDPISLMCGSGGSWLDNIHAGGLGIGVNEGGELQRFAYRLGFSDSNEKFDKHPDTGFVFEGSTVP